MERSRIGMAAGIGYFLTLFFSLPLKGDLPTADAPVEQVVAYYANQRVGLGLASALSLLSVVFLLWFVSYLRTAVDQAGGGPLALIIYGSGLLVGVTTLGTFAAQAPASFVVDLAKMNDEGVTALHAINFLGDGFFAVSIIAKAALVLSLALGFLVYGLGWKWVGWLGTVIGTVALIGTFAPIEGPVAGPLTGVFFAGSIAAVFWILLASLTLTMRPPRTRNPMG